MGIKKTLGASGYEVTLDPNRFMVQGETDANGQTVLVGEGGVSHLITEYAGMVYCKPSTYIEIPNSTQTVMEFDNVLHDPLGIYNSTTKKFVLPSDIVMLDWDVAVELANTASGYGNSVGNRTITLPAATGMGSCNYPFVSTSGATAGGGTMRFNGFGVEWDHAVIGDDFDIKFVQNSGSTIRIGDSTGVGVAQTYFKMRMYRAFV